MRPYTRKKPTIKKGAIKRFIRFIFIVFLPIFTLLFLVFSLMGYVYFSSKTPDVSSMYHYKLQEPLHIYDKNKKLIFTYGSQRRTIIKYQKIPSMLIRSIMAAEDSRFFFHHGIDFKSIVRAVIGFIKTGRAQSGASTITMQVSKISF
jgi:penicillin-binding protein 1A